MYMTKYDPFKDMRALRRSFNHLDTLFDTFEEDKESAISSFVPTVNTREGEFAYHVDVDLPGVKKEDINIDVKENVLTISGERHSKEETKEEGYYKVESSFGKFQRSFTLPENTDIEDIKASTADGVLEVVIPKLKVEKKETKKIEVK